MTQIVFLTYINRSGSTFLCQKLSEYYEVLVCPEAESLIYEYLITPSSIIKSDRSFREKVINMLTNDPKIKYWNLSPELILENADGLRYFDFFFKILDEYRKQIKPEASSIIFKGTRLINIIHLLFKDFQAQYNIKTFGLVRDPRAILFSQLFTRDPISGSIMCDNPLYLAKNWQYYTSRLSFLAQSKKVFIIKYEEMIENFDLTLQKVLNILNLNPNYKNNIGDLFSRIPINQRSIHKNVLKKPDRKRIDSWENQDSYTDTYCNILERYLSKSLQDWGYQPKFKNKAKQEYPSLIKYWLAMQILKLKNPYWFNKP